jgi:hypothetical protein
VHPSVARQGAGDHAKAFNYARQPTAVSIRSALDLPRLQQGAAHRAACLLGISGDGQWQRSQRDWAIDDSRAGSGERGLSTLLEIIHARDANVGICESLLPCLGGRVRRRSATCAHLLGCTSIFSRFDREGDNLKEACPGSALRDWRPRLAVLGTIDAVAMRPWSYRCRTSATARVRIP